MHVVATSLSEVCRGSLGKLSDPLDREDLVGNLRENCGGITGAGTDPRSASASIMKATI